MERKKRCHHYQERRFFENFDIPEVATRLEISGLTVTFYRKPVIKCLKRQVRICSRLDFNDDQTPVIRNRQEIDDLPLFAPKTRNLRINMVLPHREQLADLSDKIGLQPGFLVSTGERVMAAVTAFPGQSLHKRSKGFAE